VTPALVRTAVVDDQAVVRAGIARILGAPDGFDVVAQFGDGADLLRHAADLALDLVVMDIRMSGVDGIEATRRLRTREHAPPVLVLTTFDEDEVLWGAVEAGAAGFVLKDAGAEEILIVAGGVIPPGDHEELLSEGASAIFGPGTVIAEAATQLLETLSERLGHGST